MGQGTRQGAVVVSRGRRGLGARTLVLNAPSASLPSWVPRSGPPLSLVLTLGSVILSCHNQQSHENGI